MSKKNLSTLIQLVVFLSLGIGLIIWRYGEMTEEEKTAMFEAFSHVRLWWAFPVFIVGFFSHFFRALRWKLILEPLNIYPKTANITFAVLIGYLANILIPRLGEVAKCTVLAKYEKVPADKMVGTVIAERAFDLVCLMLLIFATLFIQFDVISPFAISLYERIFLDETGAFIWMRIFFVLFLILVFFIVLLKLMQKKRDSKIGKIIANIIIGLKAIGQIKKIGLFLIYTVLVWGLYITMAVIGFKAMPELENITWLASLAVITFGSIGMIATPGGIGAYPVIVAQVLFLYGINEGIGTAYGWISWAATTAVVIVLGVASLIILPIYNRNQK